MDAKELNKFADLMYEALVTKRVDKRRDVLKLDRVKSLILEIANINRKLGREQILNHLQMTIDELR